MAPRDSRRKPARGKGKANSAPARRDSSGGTQPPISGYDAILGDMIRLIEQARRTAARSVNSVMTGTYWLVGRRIVEEEQGGEARAEYGAALVERLSEDLTARFGRGFGRSNMFQMRAFYLAYPPPQIVQTASGESTPDKKVQTASGKLPGSSPSEGKVQTPSGGSGPPALPDVAARFPLPWSAYVLLLSVDSPEARRFYEAEALRGGWAVRQLDRQINSQFYERTALSRDKAAMLRKGEKPRPGDAVSADEEVRDPLVLEFLGLRDEYSESDLEEALIRHLEQFLLELGNDFAFVGRQRRLRIDDEWYRVDLLFFHRRLRCLVIIDLKLGKFSHADAGQMNLYLNYAREHWTQPEENPPVGVILCAASGPALVKYATGNLPNKLLVRRYLTVLPDEKLLAQEIDRTRELLERRHDKDEA